MKNIMLKFIVSTAALIAVILNCVECIGANKHPTAKIEEGRLTGKYFESRNGMTYEAYLGIRYANFPKRFENSELTSETWKGDRDATNYGPICTQGSLLGGPPVGEEDCLYLNVYTPKADTKKRPVFVYIHGGAFIFGSSDVFGPKYLIDEDVVLVTINYRLGLLGFLNTEDGVVTGNMGLKDQVVALKWVQRNIGAFGGDPSRVTIQGESAGAGSVFHHVLSPLSKGLFHRAIAQSGTALSWWGYKESTYPKAVEVGKKLKCNIGSAKDLVKCLREKPLTEILNAQSFSVFHMDPLIIFTPSLEIKNKHNPEPFLTQSPRDILKSGKFNRVPVILTICKDEGLIIHGSIVLRNDALRKQLNEEFSRIAPITFAYKDTALDTEEVSQKIRKFYFGNNEIDLDQEYNLSNVYTDTWFGNGAHEGALALAKYTPVYVGLVTHLRKDFSGLQIFGIQEPLGVAHGDDLGYLFNPTVVDAPLNVLHEVSAADDVKFSKAFVRILTSFAESGVPKIELGNSPKWIPVSKEEIKSGELNWLNLGLDPFVHISPFKERVSFWEQLLKSKVSDKSEL